METELCCDSRVTVAEYLSKKYPYAKVLAVGEHDFIREAERKGLRVIVYDGAPMPDDVKVVVCSGKRREQDLSKSLAEGRDLVFVASEIHAGLFDNIVISGYKIERKGYPNHVFIDIGKDFGSLQASAVSTAVGLYAEALGILGTGLRDRAWSTAKLVASDMVKALGADFSAEELILEVASASEKLSSVSGGFFRLAEALYPEDDDLFPAHSRFFLYFTAIFSAIQFTKCDFCVILPEKDRVRTRILCDALKIPSPKVEFSLSNAEACLKEASGFLVGEACLTGWLERFMLTAGKGTAIAEVLLDNLSLATELTGETNLYTVLADKGYIDAIAHGAG